MAKQSIFLLNAVVWCVAYAHSCTEMADLTELIVAMPVWDMGVSVVICRDMGVST